MFKYFGVRRWLLSRQMRLVTTTCMQTYWMRPWKPSRGLLTTVGHWLDFCQVLWKYRMRLGLQKWMQPGLLYIGLLGEMMCKLKSSRISLFRQLYMKLNWRLLSKPWLKYWSSCKLLEVWNLEIGKGLPKDCGVMLWYPIEKDIEFTKHGFTVSSTCERCTTGEKDVWP